MLFGFQVAINNIQTLPSDFFGSGGAGYNRYQPEELTFFVLALRDWRQRPRSEQEQLLADPWRFGAWLDGALPLWVTEGMGLNFYFGGTSLLIVVGVAMDTVQQIESQLIMRHYDGFMKKTRIRGRRG
mgnify:CR=1 FL=1